MEIVLIELYLDDSIFPITNSKNKTLLIIHIIEPEHKYIALEINLSILSRPN